MADYQSREESVQKKDNGDETLNQVNSALPISISCMQILIKYYENRLNQI